MSARAAWAAAALGALLGACGGPARARTSERASPEAVDDAAAGWSAVAPAGRSGPAPSRSLSPAAAPAAAVARPEARAARRAAVDPAPRGRRIDVAFREADLANALRFLAQAGDLDLVLSGGVTGTVTIELRRVRPLDALVALAEAHGASVERRGRLVLVRAP